MLQICILSFLVISVAGTVLFWMACAAAKRYDESIHGTNEVYTLESSKEKVHLTKPIPSTDV